MDARGSMERPRIAVTSANAGSVWMDTVGVDVPDEKAEWAAEDVFWGAKVPRRRNIAEGLSFESLDVHCGLISSEIDAEVRLTFQVAENLCPANKSALSRRSHLEKVLYHWFSTGLNQNVNENLNVPVPRRKTDIWLMELALGSSNMAWVSSICCRFV